MESIYSLRKKGFKVRVMHFRQYSYEIPPFLSSRRDLPLTIPLAPKLLPKGGKTCIQLRSPEGIETYGESVCSEKDSFDRKYGNIKALGRALAALNKQTGNIS